MSRRVTQNGKNDTNVLGTTFKALRLVGVCAECGETHPVADCRNSGEKRERATSLDADVELLRNVFVGKHYTMAITNAGRTQLVRNKKVVGHVIDSFVSDECRDATNIRRLIPNPHSERHPDLFTVQTSDGNYPSYNGFDVAEVDIKCFDCSNSPSFDIAKFIPFVHELVDDKNAVQRKICNTCFLVFGYKWDDITATATIVDMVMIPMIHLVSKSMIRGNLNVNVKRDVEWPCIRPKNDPFKKELLSYHTLVGFYHLLAVAILQCPSMGSTETTLRMIQTIGRRLNRMVLQDCTVVAQLSGVMTWCIEAVRDSETLWRRLAETPAISMTASEIASAYSAESPTFLLPVPSVPYSRCEAGTLLPNVDANERIRTLLFILLASLKVRRIVQGKNKWRRDKWVCSS